MNRATTALTVLLLGGYLAFEATHVYRFQDRMRPAYILDEFVVADRAMALCGTVTAEQRERFLTKLEILRRRALAALEAADSEGSHEATLGERIQQKQTEVEERIADKGCSDSEVWRWLKLYEIRGRLRVVDSTADKP